MLPVLVHREYSNRHLGVYSNALGETLAFCEFAFSVMLMECLGERCLSPTQPWVKPRLALRNIGACTRQPQCLEIEIPVSQA